MPLRSNTTPGVRRLRSSMLRSPCASSFSWLNALTLMGTSCRRSSRRVAVTTTSWRPALAPLSVPVVCALIGITSLSEARADSAPRTAGLTHRFIQTPRAPLFVGAANGSVGGRERRGAVHGFSADHREQNLHIRDLLCRNLEDIAVEHDEVGELADFERPYVVLRVQLVGRVGGYRPQGGRQRESRIGAESPRGFRAGRRVVLARHSHLDGKPLIEWIDRPIAATGDARTGRRQITRGLEVFETLRSQIILRAVDRVRCGLLPLEREH